MTSREEQIREYLEDLARLRTEANAMGEDSLHDLETELLDVERRAREVEREFREYRAYKDAGQRLSDELDRTVESIGERVAAAWRRLKEH